MAEPEPKEPTEPVEPTEPTEPVEPTEPTEPAEPTEPKEPETVSYERFKEVVDKVKQLEEQAEVSAQQMALARANPPQGQSQRAQQPQFDIFKEVGLEDEDDVPTVKQHRQILEHYGKVFDSRLAEIAFQQAHPDYADLVGTADEIASQRFAEPLAAAIKKNPALLQDIARSPDPRLAAYNIAKLQKEKAPDKEISKEEAKKAIDEAAKNAARIKSSSNAKGGGALSEEGRYASMSDADFLKLAASHGAIV